MSASVPAFEHREHDHQRCASDALRHAERIARRDGLRLTDQRRAVLKALLMSHVPASAYDVIDRVAEAEENGRRLAPVSVYRALEFLTEHRFAHRIESKNAYVACDRGEECAADATLFLICDNCGAAGEAPSSALAGIVNSETRAQSFSPRASVLEVRGLCARCRAA
jgi:Fur family zinc uptake transcriptional regulator